MGRDLTQALFEQCDFAGATFERTVLGKSDLRSSFNYVLDPETDRIKKARFSLAAVAGLLQKYGIEVE